MAKKEMFIKFLEKEGYKLNGAYWEQPNNNTLISVRDTNFARVHRFESGMLGTIEILPFSKTHTLRWKS